MGRRIQRNGFKLCFERLGQRKLFAGDACEAATTDADDGSTSAEVGEPVAGSSDAASSSGYEIGGVYYHDPYGIGHCDPNYGSGYYVTVYVDQPGIGGDADPIEGNDTGHTWIEVGYEGGGSASGGLYPGLPGDLRDDSANGHGYDVYITLPISQEQYEAMVEQLEEDDQNPPPWTPSHHCVDYALEFLAEHTDHEIESDPIQYPIGTGTGTSPGTVGQDIVDDYGGSYAPGSTAGGS